MRVHCGTIGEERRTKVEKEVICTELGVELSDKPEVNLPFATKFKFIGTELDTTDTCHIIR